MGVWIWDTGSSAFFTAGSYFRELSNNLTFGLKILKYFSIQCCGFGSRSRCLFLQKLWHQKFYFLFQFLTSFKSKRYVLNFFLYILLTSSKISKKNLDSHCLATPSWPCFEKWCKFTFKSNKQKSLEKISFIVALLKVTDENSRTPSQSP